MTLAGGWRRHADGRGWGGVATGDEKIAINYLSDVTRDERNIFIT